MLKQIVTLLLLLFSQIVLAQPKVETIIDSTNMMIGDQVNMELQVKHTPKTVVLMPKGLKLGNNIEVLSERDSTKEISSNEILTSKKMLITSFDSGVYVIPPVPIQVEENGIIDTIFSQAMQLTVVSPTIDSTKDFAPIKDIFQEDLSFKEDILPVIAGILIIVLLIISVWYYAKYKKEKVEAPKAIQEEVQLPAHVIAFMKLKELDDEKVWQKGNFKTYYSEISHIIRDYLENRYKIPALESVTDEILTDLKGFEIERPQVLHLQKVLQTADLVKFAKVIPTEEEHKNTMAFSLEFVRETQLVEVVADNEEGGEIVLDAERQESVLIVEGGSLESGEDTSSWMGRMMSGIVSFFFGGGNDED